MYQWWRNIEQYEAIPIKERTSVYNQICLLSNNLINIEITKAFISTLSSGDHFVAVFGVLWGTQVDWQSLGQYELESE